METARGYYDEDFTVERAGWSVLTRVGLSVFASLFRRDEDRRKIQEAENISARLIISVDGRRNGLTFEEFSDMIETPIIESPDDVEFETKSGRRVRRGSLILSKSVNIRAFDKTVNHADAWGEMSRYLLELRDEGFLEL